MRSVRRDAVRRAIPATAAACVMITLGLWGLSRGGSMYNDEAATHWAASLGLDQLINLLGHIDAVHGFYYLLMHGWMQLGTSPALMRVPSVMGMAGAVALTVLVGCRLTGSTRAGLFAGLIMAVTPSISYYAQTGRSYALVCLGVMGMTFALLRALDTETGTGATARRRWLLYAGLVTISGYLHEFSLLVLLAHGLTLVLARRERRILVNWSMAAAGGAVLVLPLIVLSNGEAEAVNQLTAPGLRALLGLYGNDFGSSAVIGPLVVLCALTAVVPSRSYRRRHAGRAGQSEPEPALPPGQGPGQGPGKVALPTLALPLLLVPAATLILVSLVVRPLFVDRYVLYSETGAALLAGAGLDRVCRLLGRRARPASAWTAGLVVVAIVFAGQLPAQQHARSPNSREADYGGLAQYVQEYSRAGDGILFITSYARLARLGYPADYRRVSDFALASSPAATGTFRGRYRPARVVRMLMRKYQRIWVVTNTQGELRTSGPPAAERSLLRSRYTVAQHQEFRGVDVTLWQARDRVTQTAHHVGPSNGHGRPLVGARRRDRARARRDPQASRPVRAEDHPPRASHPVVPPEVRP